MKKKIILIAPEAPPFGGMANQARLLSDCLSSEGAQVFYIPTNKVPDRVLSQLWLLPVFRTIGKFLVYIVGILRLVKKCGTIHIFACSHMYFYLNVIPAILIGKIFKKQVVVNYRGGEAKSFFKGPARYCLELFNLTDSLIVPSGYLKSVFSGLGIQAKIIPNISEIARFHFSSPNYEGNIKFICTRNFEAYYDIMTIVRAFRLVKDELSNSSLTLIGEGSLKNNIIGFVETSGLSGSVKFLGKIDPQDMPGYLSTHDIYVNSSIVDNYPISLLEAFASGLPVISTSAGGIPYLVENGVTGILVPPKDYRGLAREMICLANNLAFGKNLSINAKRIADEHSWEKIWPKLKAEYQW